MANGFVHKVLDLMGDLALLGKPLKAFVMAVRGSHRLHAQLVKKIAKEALIARCS